MPTPIPTHSEVLPEGTTQEEANARVDALEAAGWQNCKLTQENDHYRIQCNGFQ